MLFYTLMNEEGGAPALEEVGALHLAMGKIDLVAMLLHTY